MKSVSANGFQKKLPAAMINSPCITPMAVGWLVEMKGRLFFLLVAAGTRLENRLPGPTKD